MTIAMLLQNMTDSINGTFQRETDDLIAATKDQRITAGEFSKRYSRLQSQWTRLDDELRSIENKLYKR